MGEVYYCEYVKTGSKLERVGELKVCKPELVVLSDRVKDQLSLVGNAWSEYWNKFDHQLVSAAVQLEGIIYPGATALLELAEGRMNARDLIAAADFKPEYVRNDVAKKASTGKA
jgi:tRNA threonylcarbamoyladenosine biosynthesis protein TsaB